MQYGIFSCSPRTGGNSDFCASLVYKQLKQMEHLPTISLFYPCRKSLQACTGCGFCDNGSGQCTFSLQKNDTVTSLYTSLFQLNKALFIVPVYFYHVPANFKAFLDRAQAWYAVPREQKPANNLVYDLVLMGAREKGEKLFEGARLSIKYAMQCIGAEPGTCLCLHGLDKPDDLAKNPQKQQQILDSLCSNPAIL